MPDKLTLGAERAETIRELSNLLFVVQEMGHRLADETHGEPYALVNELNQTLHQARFLMTQLEELSAARQENI